MPGELTADALLASSPPARLSSQLRKHLGRSTLALSRGSAILAQFGAQLAVAALAGASGLGILQLFTAWTCIAGEVLALGLPARAMRRVSVAGALGQQQHAQQLIRESRRMILRAWLWLVLLAGAALPVLMYLRTPADWTQFHWLLLATGITAPLFALLRLYAESLKATGAALPAVTLENLGSPLTLLLMCAICWLAGQPVMAMTLVLTFGLGMLITPVALWAVLRQQLRNIPPRAPGRVGPEAEPRAELLYLWGNSVLSIGFLQLPFLVMPVYVDTAAIGVFSVAHKLINVVTTLLLLLAAVYGPAFARSAARSDRAGLLALLRRTQRLSTAVFIPAALILVALAEPLAQLFGEEFTGLRIFLVILAAGHLVNAATGLCGVLLTMAGAASRELATLVLALAVALVGSAWVGPRYGATGLALVFSASIALKNLASYVVARHLLKTRGEPT